MVLSLQWRNNDHDSVSNHQPRGCLLNLLFRRRSKKTSKLRVTGLCVGNSPGPVNSPHKGPVTRKMFPFDDVIMVVLYFIILSFISLSVVDSCVVFTHIVMTSSNGNIFRAIGLLCGEFTSHWWIPLTKASGAKICCFLLSAPAQTVG